MAQILNFKGDNDGSQEQFCFKNIKLKCIENL